MTLIDGKRTLTVHLTKTTGKVTRQLKQGGISETVTSRSFKRIVEVQVLAEVDDLGLARMIQRAYKTKGHRCTDGPLRVTVRELIRYGKDVPEMCSLCNGDHDSGIYCNEAKEAQA